VARSRPKRGTGFGARPIHATRKSERADDSAFEQRPEAFDFASVNETAQHTRCGGEQSTCAVIPTIDLNIDIRRAIGLRV
jgi:hypothetical protein